jgi:hypothetical protein
MKYVSHEKTGLMASGRWAKAMAAWAKAASEAAMTSRGIDHLLSLLTVSRCLKPKY